MDGQGESANIQRNPKKASKNSVTNGQQGRIIHLLNAAESLNVKSVLCPLNMGHTPFPQRNQAGRQQHIVHHKYPSQAVVDKTTASGANSLRKRDGFFMFSLAMHEHIRRKMKGEVTHEMVSEELRRIWAQMGESQRHEWSSQAASFLDADTTQSTDDLSGSEREGSDFSDKSGELSEKSQTTSDHSDKSGQSGLSDISKSDGSSGQSRPSADSSTGSSSRGRLSEDSGAPTTVHRPSAPAAAAPANGSTGGAARTVTMASGTRGVGDRRLEEPVRQRVRSATDAELIRSGGCGGSGLEGRSRHLLMGAADTVAWRGLAAPGSPPELTGSAPSWSEELPAPFRDYAAAAVRHAGWADPRGPPCAADLVAGLDGEVGGGGEAAAQALAAADEEEMQSRLEALRRLLDAHLPSAGLPFGRGASSSASAAARPPSVAAAIGGGIGGRTMSRSFDEPPPPLSGDVGEERFTISELFARFGARVGGGGVVATGLGPVGRGPPMPPSPAATSQFLPPLLSGLPGMMPATGLAVGGAGTTACSLSPLLSFVGTGAGPGPNFTVTTTAPRMGGGGGGGGGQGSLEFLRSSLGMSGGSMDAGLCGLGLFPQVTGSGSSTSAFSHASITGVPLAAACDGGGGGCTSLSTGSGLRGGSGGAIEDAAAAAAWWRREEEERLERLTRARLTSGLGGFASAGAGGMGSAVGTGGRATWATTAAAAVVASAAATEPQRGGARGELPPKRGAERLPGHLRNCIGGGDDPGPSHRPPHARAARGGGRGSGRVGRGGSAATAAAALREAARGPPLSWEAISATRLGMREANATLWARQAVESGQPGRRTGPAPAKRTYECTRTSGPMPEPEPPQVRTMTFVCDLFSPHDCQVNLQMLSERCELSPAGVNGIVGLSFQYQTATGPEVVKRGQVKDAKRHFAHQAQLRLSLPSSPNVSVKVFSTGRLQIAGCRDEPSCVQAVKMVGRAFNRIMEQPGGAEVIRRQARCGDQAGEPLPGPVNLEALPRPQIVMINCSFDSGVGALGYGLDAHALTRMLVAMRAAGDASVEDVSYTPDQRYTGVKIKYRPPVGGSSAAAAAAAAAAGDGGGGGASSGPRRLSEREVFIGVFPSGKAVITGAVTWEEVDKAYEFARGVICDNFEIIRTPLAESPAPRKKARRGCGSGAGMEDMGF